MSVNLSMLLVFGAFAISTPGQTDVPTIKSVGFMAGCWEMNNAERKSVISEQWMMPAGNAMLGISRTVKAEKMIGYEFMKLVVDANGITFYARPHNAKEDTPFKMTKWSANEATFENPANDFPQKITYKLATPDSLFARIEGPMNGKVSGIDFPYVRVKCN
ncbi:MAG: hypothetical protein K1X36_03150 [Pyrinomonadaceae bacterium]|nr:hypothetical protein [Pyrinomonadaceae bacterium]